MRWNPFAKSDSAAAEATQYFRDTEKTSRPVAFLLALVSFLVAFAVVFGVIMGGKWAWERIRNNQTSTEQVATETTPTTQPESTLSPSPEITPVPTSTPAPAAVVASPTPAPQSVNTSSPTPSASPRIAVNGALPSTGNNKATILLVFVVFALIGGVYHNARQRSRAS